MEMMMVENQLELLSVPYLMQFIINIFLLGICTLCLIAINNCSTADMVTAHVFTRQRTLWHFKE